MLRLKPASILRAVMVAVVTCVVAPLATASAGTYTAGYLEQAPISDTTVDWTYTESAGGYWYAENQFSFNGYHYRRFGPNDRAIPAGASSNLTYTAPRDTYISYVSWVGGVDTRVQGAADSMYAWLDNGSKVTLATQMPGSLPIGNGSYSFGPERATTVQSSLYCAPNGLDCWGITPDWNYGNVWYFHGAQVVLVDPYDPVFSSTGGPGWAQTPADGPDAINYSLTDRGAGVKSVDLYVDGIKRATNNVSCSRSDTPCPSSNSGSFTFDTTQLSEGDHAVRLVGRDFSGNTVDAARTVTIRRKPAVSDPAPTDPAGTNSHAPSVGGYTTPFTEGEQATGDKGTWTGNDISYSYQWKRCDANGVGCADIPGATSLTYATTSSDVGRKLVFCVTATSTGGTTTQCSQPSAIVQADADHDGVPDALDRCPSSAATTSDGCPAPTTTNSGADPNFAPGGPPTPVHSIVPTTTNPSTTSTSTSALSNTIDRGALNGTNGGDGSKLSAYVNSRFAVQKVGFGKRAVITGRLVTPSGSPVADAVLVVQQRFAQPTAATTTVGKLVTEADGRFTYTAPPGPSRTIRFAYRSHVNDTDYADTTEVRVLVSAGVTIKRKPRTVRNRHTTIFTGRVLGGPIPARGVVVNLQVFFRHRWRTFAAPRTNRAGAYRFRYRFMAGAATWRFRARVMTDSAYPYETGTSGKPIKVKVTP
jgi:hypothetical protein